MVYSSSDKAHVDLVLAVALAAHFRGRIRQQMLLINKAQTAEINAFQANLGAGKSGVEQLMIDIQKLMGVTVKDENGNVTGLLGIVENQTIAAVSGWLNQLPTMMAATPAQQAAMRQASTTNYYSGPSLNMPIYTNNSPEAMQQSLAIAGVMLP